MKDVRTPPTPPTTAPRRTQSGKSTEQQKVRIPIKHRGELGVFGYKNVRSKDVQTRHRALNAAASSLGWLHIVRNLGALYVFNKYRYPDLAATFKQNRDYARSKL